jgi:hypothetical protein
MRRAAVYISIAMLAFIAMQRDAVKPVIAQDCPIVCDNEDLIRCIEGGGAFDTSTCICTPSPIIIDLNNDGSNLTDAAHGVIFDLEANGTPRQYAWTSAGGDEAFLALDRDNDGRITSGKELFGNFTDQPVTEEPNGFVALSVFDLNGDRWIDASDDIYTKLRLWIDANHDGVSQQSELFSLESKGVTRLAYDYKLSKRSDRHGNRFKYKAKAQINGIERWVWDIYLNVMS